MARARWSDIREEHMGRIGREEFEPGKESLMADFGDELLRVG
jgi:hypothetical protein